MTKWAKTHQPCPECDSSDGYSIDTQGGGYCFACQHYEAGGEGGNESKSFQDETPLTPTQSDLVIGGSHLPISSRRISSDTCSFFDVKINNNKVVFPYCDSNDALIAQKVRPLDQKVFFWKGQARSPKLFGQSKFKAGNIITIVEGEFDALAFREISGDFPVVSVPNGAQTAVKDIRNNLEYFEGFNKIHICFDSDDAGKKAARKVAELFPIGKAKIVDLRHYKDANEYLMNNAKDEFKRCWWNAEEYTPAGIEAANKGGYESLFDDIDDIELFPYPFDKLNEYTFGLRKSEMVTVVSGSGVGKCFSRETPILMWDGSIKPVDLVQVGDKVMGPDSSPRTVTGTHTVEEYGYRVNPNKGSEPFVCSDEHTLCVYDTKTKKYEEVTPKELNNLPPSVQKRKKLYRRGVKTFGVSEHIPLLDPYYVGLWLGDGSVGSTEITTADQEIVDYLTNLSVQLNYAVVRREPYSYSITKTTGRHNTIMDRLRWYGILENKRIPKSLLLNTEEVRLKILAGLVDSDGHVLNNCIEITQKRPELVQDIIFLARSLGYCVTSTVKTVTLGDFTGDYIRLFISGEGLEKIPTILPRKKLNSRKQIKDARVTSFTLERLNHKKIFYGFELDGDHLHLLGDFTVTHNSQVIGETAYNLLMTTQKKIGMLMLEESTLKTKKRLLSLRMNRPLHLTLLGRLKGKFEFLDKVLDKLFVNKESYKWDESMRSEIKTAWDDVIERRAEDGDPQLWLFNHFGSNDIDTIVNRIDSMVTGLGCEFIFLDHISIVVSEQQNGDERKALDELATKLRTLVERRNFSLIIVSHLRRPGGKPHEEGGETSLADIRGTAGIGQLSDIVIGLERNGQHQDEYVRNVTKMRVLKNRYSGLTGLSSYAHYDLETGRLEEVDGEEVEARANGTQEGEGYDFDDETTVFDSSPFGTQEKERNTN